MIIITNIALSEINMYHIFSVLSLVLLAVSCTYHAQPGASDFSKYQGFEIQLDKDSISSDTVFGNFHALRLVRTIQAFDPSQTSEIMTYDESINSPKSVKFNQSGTKFYVQSLEGYTTVVYSVETFEKLKEIKHVFNANTSHLFKNDETTIFDYPYKQERNNYNHFMGKPVESCLSHGGKYLWVTYYRRDFDPSASSPSAVAIIDTDIDEIVRVMPCGPLPKMIACSPDNKRIAVTHWGDNTVAIINIDSEDVMDFHYTNHVSIDGQLKTDFAAHVDRDNNCGNCLRGTLFTPDGRFLLIAKMG
jgi:hypothetical protein